MNDSPTASASKASPSSLRLTLVLVALFFLLALAWFALSSCLGRELREAISNGACSCSCCSWAQAPSWTAIREYCAAILGRGRREQGGRRRGTTRRSGPLRSTRSTSSLPRMIIRFHSVRHAPLVRPTSTASTAHSCHLRRRRQREPCGRRRARLLTSAWFE